MGLFSGIVDTLFGGGESEQSKTNSRTQEMINQRTEQARDDIMRLAPIADANRNIGYQAALDILGQAMPQQLDAFQQGNVNAQNAIKAGMPQFQNAIMGLPVNYGVFQPQQVQYSDEFTQQKIPEYISLLSILGSNPMGGDGGQASPALDQGRQSAPQQPIAQPNPFDSYF